MSVATETRTGSPCRTGPGMRAWVISYSYSPIFSVEATASPSSARRVASVTVGKSA